MTKMSIGKRNRAWPLAIVLSVAAVGVLAAFIALAVQQTAPASAHGPEICHTPFAAVNPACAAEHPHADGVDPSPSPSPTTPVTADAKTVTSSSTSGSATATVELKLKITLTEDVRVGGAIVLYLEDDYQEPDSISASDVYFVVTPGNNNTSLKTGNGARVYATQNPEIDTDDHFTKDKKDIDIRVSVPDLCTTDTPDCQDLNGLMSGDMVTMVIQKSAGIKNPSEAGTHSTGYLIIGPADAVPGSAAPSNQPFIVTDVLKTLAKISLSDVDNSRGYEMTVTGSGFNNGTTAGVYVLAHARFLVADWWETLDCPGMKAAMGSDSNKLCLHYDLNEMYKSYSIATDRGHAEFLALDDDDQKMYSDMVFTQHLCRIIVEGKTFHPTQANGMRASRAAKISGTEVGSALVGSDDKVAVTFEVTAPTFKPGNVNYICMVDGEGRASSTDVEDFNLEPSIKVVPSNVSSGDTVNVFAQDFHNTNAGLSRVKIATTVISATGSGIRPDGSGTATFRVPGGLEGVLRIDAMWGDANSNGKCDTGESTCINEDSKITIAGADLEVSKTDVRPNETITINGNGFGTGTGTCIPFSNITLDNEPVMVHPDSKGCTVGNEDGVEVSNSGQFVATIILWPAMTSGGTNPTLIPGTHELSVEDNKEFTSSVNLMIAEPTITVGPDVAGPRDYITIMGENWPVDNLDNTLNKPTVICVEDFGQGEECNGRSYPVYADSVGRFTVEHRVHRRVAIPSTVQVKATYEDVAKIGSFAVPASTIEVSPAEGQPGDTVTLTAANMPVYNEVDYVEIGGTSYDDPGVNTDRDGNVTVEGVLIPGLDPGVYSVVINVQGTIAIGEVNVLAESSAAGAPAELPGATESLGDNLVAIFHFDDVGKEWSFYDPRPEFADLNTLTEMVNGEAYWILVSETVDDVVLNNKVRSLTCRGADCWNLEVW